jgi:uncharacterized membrane protein
VTKGRLEAFSDGVIAIAATLLVLNLKVPLPGSGSLGRALAHQWPGYLAYATSFLTIGIIWINHHATMRRLAEVDHSILVLNLALLMSIGVLPWTTAVLAEYLRNANGQDLAAALYAGSFLLMSLIFYALQRHTLVNRRQLLHETVRRDADLDAIRRRSRTGLVPYAVATALAPLSAYVTIAICALIAVFYALPSPLEEPAP